MASLRTRLFCSTWHCNIQTDLGPLAYLATKYDTTQDLVIQCPEFLYDTDIDRTCDHCGDNTSSGEQQGPQYRTNILLSKNILSPVKGLTSDRLLRNSHKAINNQHFHDSVEVAEEAVIVFPSEITNLKQDTQNRKRFPSKSVQSAYWQRQTSDLKTLHKVIIVGDPSVGKSSFISREVNGRFPDTHKVTFGVDFALKVTKVAESISVKLQIWDIPGQTRMSTVTRVYYRNAHACVVMFDLTDRRSFENTAKWKKEVDANCQLPDGQPIPCLLLGNKVDVDKRQVEREEIEMFCREHGFSGWADISVKDNVMVEETMRFLVGELMDSYGNPDDHVPVMCSNFETSTRTITLSNSDLKILKETKCC